MSNRSRQRRRPKPLPLIRPRNGESYREFLARVSAICQRMAQRDPDTPLRRLQVVYDANGAWAARRRDKNRDYTRLLDLHSPLPRVPPWEESD